MKLLTLQSTRMISFYRGGIIMKTQEKLNMLKQYKKILEFVKEEQIKNEPTYEKPKVKVLTYKYNGKNIKVA